MIVPLKILVCSLKSVKQFPVVQNDSRVMNTLESLDSLVKNTMGSRLLGKFRTNIRFTKKLSGDK